MLFKISIKNIQKSMKDYAIYFFTLIIGVTIFYVFNAIETQSAMLKVTSNTREIIQLMSSMLAGISVFVSFILAFLIIYASRFLIKRRTKEFGIYLILGMGKRKISMILFLETLIIGLISLATGLIAGVCVSQLVSIFVANMFEADLTEFVFVFSGSAFVKTVTYFGIIYLFVILFNTMIVSRCKLIDLFCGEKKSEQIKWKNPVVCIIVFFISAAVLARAYWYVTVGVSKINSDGEIYVPMILGAVSTFFIFWSLSGLLLKIVMSAKKVYFKGLNSFTFRQVSSKINSTVFAMTVICLMLFLTICILSSALSIKNAMNENLRKLVPVDLQLEKRMNMDHSYLKQGYNRKQIKSSTLRIGEVCRKAGYDIEQQLKEKVSFYTYETKELTLKDTLGDKVEEISKTNLLLRYNMPEKIIKISDYNRVARLYGNETYSLEDDQYIVIADFDSAVKVRNEVLKSGKTISLEGKTLNPKYQECKPGFIEMSPTHVNSGIVIVPDNAISDQYIAIDNMIGNYKADTQEEKQAIEQKIYDLEKVEKDYLLPDGGSKIVLAESSVGLAAIATFISLYLGSIFLISGAAILALKELSESADNIDRFRMLRKLGADEKMIHKALFRQIGIFFLFPLILAGIHSIFGIQFCLYILETFGNKNLLASILCTAGILVAIYGGYFIITYWCSKNIIKEK